VLAPTDIELELDALVAREQRQKPVRRRGPDDLDPATRLEVAEYGNDVAVDRPEERAQAREALAPVVDERNEMRVAGLLERRRRFVAVVEALLEVQLELSAKRVARQLIREHGREPDGHGRGDAFRIERPERLDEREIRIDRRLGDPVAAVRPASVIQDVREVAMEREDEVHSELVNEARTARVEKRCLL
jgi:hypothetical protein